MTINFLMISFMLLMIMNCSITPLTSPSPNLPDFDKLWDYNDPATTELKFRDLLSDIIYEEASEYYLELNTQIARTMGLQQNFEAAHKLLDDVESKLSEKFPIAKIRYLLERGRVLNSSGNSEKSKPLFLQAWELTQKTEADFYAVDAAHMLGIVENPEQQLFWNEKAMDIAENSDDPRAQDWLGSLYNNIGWTYHTLENYEQALLIFQKGHDWQQSRNKVSETQIAKWTIARTHRSLGNIDLALGLQFALEKEILESGNAEDGYVAEEIAECLTLKGVSEAATPYFLKAWTLLSQDPWLVKNEADRLARLEELGSAEH